jgi:hypothetical protein
MKLGVIESGALSGKKILLEPRDGLMDNEYMVEQGPFLNGAPKFSKFCLICERAIPDNGCPFCK